MYMGPSIGRKDGKTSQVEKTLTSYTDTLSNTVAS